MSPVSFRPFSCSSKLYGVHWYLAPLHGRLTVMPAQARWFEEGLTNIQKGVLRQLRIYETVPSDDKADEADCLDLFENRSMPPLGVDSLLLKGCKLVLPGSLYEAKVLEECLGVSRLSSSAFLIEHVLPRFNSTSTGPLLKR